MNVLQTKFVDNFKKECGEKLPASGIQEPFIKIGITTARDRIADTVRIFTDSQSLFKEFQTFFRQKRTIVQELSIQLHQVSQHHAVRIVWILAHVGVDKHERVDQLAKPGVELPMTAQAGVSIDMVDVKV